MGTRPKFTFDPPQEIYDMRYAEVVREIEGDLFKWRWQVIEAFEREFPDEDAQMLAFIAGDADQPEKILELAASGILGPECRDQMTLAIAHLADHHTKNYVRGYWPDWSKE
ncbi:hypothetical protein LMG26842_05822 [Achromobacter dolens]|uniref:hypothetical protein n=1 Tax=Achromobacter dolens TaxID=1287738 RepID=UPI001468A7C6|nr:hypothetical protein [Achromobacter dolens]CAB3910069.1 hypothetical protein LMG26842_05822 [Achromobacter dolens]